MPRKKREPPVIKAVSVLMDRNQIPKFKFFQTLYQDRATQSISEGKIFENILEEYYAYIKSQK